MEKAELFYFIYFIISFLKMFILFLCLKVFYIFERRRKNTLFTIYINL